MYGWDAGRAEAGLRAYLFSADAAEYIRREQPAWQAWLHRALRPGLILGALSSARGRW